MSLWWQIWGIGIIELVVFVGLGIFVLVKLHSIISTTKYRQNNNSNKANSINQISNHKKMPDNSRIVCEPISQDSRGDGKQNTNNYNRSNILPILHNESTISKVKSHVNHNRKEPD